ncbi:DNA-binding response regulator [Rubrivivax sp. RP6-9]|uniref:response regulator transcription factor n=1 Tax=Rubrivivax sp. RP6-9 TaxID=3415750 RepID=UPI003CC54E6A
MTPCSAIKVLVRHADPVSRVGLVSTFRDCTDFVVLDDDGVADRPAPRPSVQPCADVVVADYENALALVGGTRAGTRSGAHPRARPAGKVLVLSGSSREWEIRCALASGVHGILLVGCALDELAHAVRTVHRGQRYLSPPVASHLAETLALEPLTAREQEVLRLLVEGLGNKSIARHLDIAVGTVKSHLKGIFEKLQVTSRTQAIHVAGRRGLLREGTQHGM